MQIFNKRKGAIKFRFIDLPFTVVLFQTSSKTIINVINVLLIEVFLFTVILLGY